MFHKEIKYLVAHRLLRYLEHQKHIVTGIGDEKLFSVTYQKANLQDIPRKWNGIETYRETAWMLWEDGKIDFWGNTRHRYNVDIKIKEPEGVTALREKKYIWKFLKSANTLIAGIPATIGVLFAIVKGLQALIGLL